MFIALLILAVSFVEGDAKKLLCGPNIFSLTKYDPETHICRDYVVIPKTDSNSLVNGDESKLYNTATLVLNGRHSHTRVPENLPKHSTTSLITTESKTLLCENLVKYDTKTHTCQNGKIVMIRSKTRVPANLPKHSTTSLTTTESKTLLCGDLVKYDTKTHKCQNGKLVMIRSKTRVPGNLPKHSTTSLATTKSKPLLCGDLVKYDTKTHKCQNGKIVMIRSRTRVPGNLPKHSTTFPTTTESKILLCGDLVKYDTKTHKCQNGKIVMIRSRTRVPGNLPKHSTTSLATTESKPLLCGDLVKYDTKTHTCEDGKVVMIRSTINPTTRKPITMLQEKSRTTRKEISEKTSVGQNSIERSCSCSGVNVYPRRNSAAPCQHSSRNDAFLSGKLRKMKLLGSMICDENNMFAYRLRISGPHSGKNKERTAKVTQYKRRTDMNTGRRYFVRMPTVFGIKIPLDKYSPSRLRRKGFLIVSNYRCLNDRIFFLCHRDAVFNAPKVKRMLLKKLRKVQANCTKQ
ncbi:uncharacterized protein LOC123545487 [Mercenaria mercenaria]|uniref:uncharacterized protein LOC123545487 n=1 Tax=Mercenaria mercenaria TaxID=6596 RepID=UPI00234E47E2|nr:uncharacterized protein LOC123545487 [Mercenaria mercenaria]